MLSRNHTWTVAVALTCVVVVGGKVVVGLAAVVVVGVVSEVPEPQAPDTAVSPNRPKSRAGTVFIVFTSVGEALAVHYD